MCAKHVVSSLKRKSANSNASTVDISALARICSKKAVILLALKGKASSAAYAA